VSAAITTRLQPSAGNTAIQSLPLPGVWWRHNNGGVDIGVAGVTMR